MSLDSFQSSSAPFPKSVLSVSRAEFFTSSNDGHDSDWKSTYDKPDGPPLDLKIADDSGPLPSDLKGYVFIVGPVGSIDCLGDSKNSSKTNGKSKEIKPTSDGWTSMLNGDGMIRRLDFNPANQPGKALLNSRIVKTPCYYMDVKTHSDKNTEGFPFISYGLTRVSPKLGFRSQSNTAFLPLIPTDFEQPARLLVTWDAGRPYEIDTKSLETITPIGQLSEWKLLNPLFELDRLPFSQIQTSAHPCFDREKQQFITINICKSLLTLVPPLSLSLLFSIWRVVSQNRDHHPAQKNSFLYLLKKVLPITLLNGLFKDPLSLLSSFKSPLYLVTWDLEKKNESGFRKYELKVDDGSSILGSPIGIRQTVHQMGLTRDYIVLMETAFKLNLSEMFAPLKLEKIFSYVKKKLSKQSTLSWILEKVPFNLEKDPQDLRREESSLRDLLDVPQFKNTNLYIIKRDDLKEQDAIFAKKIELEGAINHFLVDYENPNDQISIHIGFVSGWDVAEWVREGNTWDGKELKNPPLGSICGPLDIGQLGRVILNAKEGKVLSDSRLPSEQQLDSNKLIWGPSLYAYRDYPTPEQPNPERQIHHLYWNCQGCNQDLITDQLLRLYNEQNYGFPHRKMSLDTVLKITRDGLPSSLLRLDIATSQNSSDLKALKLKDYTIGDYFQAPSGYYMLSPQFVPRSGGNGGSMDGYIVCVMHYEADDEPDNGNQIWIFDAANLKRGPICKLWHPQLSLGFTIHTAWLPQICSRQASYYVDMYEDYGSIVKEQPEEIKELFKEVFPKYNWE